MTRILGRASLAGSIVLLALVAAGQTVELDPKILTYQTPHDGRGVHYDGAKDEEAMVLITGMGPATSTQVKQD
jgi:hypothetical protein